MTTTNESHVAVDLPTRVVYSTDNSVYQVLPEAVATPKSVDELAALVRRNARRSRPRAIGARGGGTGTNGQSLTDGLVIDVKRHLNRVLELDLEARTVKVEPGLVTAELNALLAPHGLHWAPHTSTLNRATVGGMISTDAAGKGSMIHGRTHRHVIALDAVLADGTPWVCEAISVAEAERRSAGDSTAARVWRALLDLPIDDRTRFDIPELARGFSGYGIDRLRRHGLIDPTALLCGAEGTLAIVTGATLKLTPLPTHPLLAVASYASFDEALRDAVRLRDTGPTAIECFDETTLDRGKASPAWPALGEIVGDDRQAVLLLEYDDPPDAASLVAVIGAGPSRRVTTTHDAGVQAAIWKVRADAVGLLAKVAVGGPERSARPTAFVEDCAVPVAEMAEFIGSFRRLLDDAGVVYGMFGHADVGCVHVRPALDLTDTRDRELHASLTDAVTDLVHHHGGILWGEHGRGFRGHRIDDVLDAETIELMRRIKTAFDPDDVMNPGKLYRPLGVSDPLPAPDEPGLRGAHDAAIPLEVRRAHDHAFACNGNGLCHHWSPDEVMCPSYTATGDPALSPRGRADLVRAWLRDHRGDQAFEQALRDNLAQCLSCGACTGHCPVTVDIPELKSRALHELGPEPGIARLRQRLLGSFEHGAWVASLLPPRLLALSTPIVERATGLVDLPMPKTRRRVRAADRIGERARSGSATRVVVMPDVFTGALERETLESVLVVLERLELAPAIGDFVASGKFDHVKGQRGRFAKAVDRRLDAVTEIVAAGATPLVIEPAIALLHRHEYPATCPSQSWETVRTLPEVLRDNAARLRNIGGGRPVTVLGHCTERATAPEQLTAWTEVLAAAGFRVDAPTVGCCGMAGIFGHEPGNQAMSRDLWEASWAPRVEAGETHGAVVAATGYSCRSQAARHGHDVVHPVQLLAEL